MLYHIDPPYDPHSLFTLRCTYINNQPLSISQCCLLIEIDKLLGYYNLLVKMMLYQQKKLKGSVKNKTLLHALFSRYEEKRITH